MSRSASHSAESALCLSCRLCCDGTMFPLVKMHDGEVDRLREIGLAAEFIFDGQEHRMRQPCPADSSSGCTIYACRPFQCSKYRCTTLQALAQGSIDFAEARRRIDEILDQRARLVSQCGVSNLDEARAQVQQGEIRHEQDAAPRSPAVFDLLILERLIDLYLRTSRDAITMGNAAGG